MTTYHQKRHRRTRCPKCQEWREGNSQARRHHCGEFAGRDSINRALDREMDQLLAEAGITEPKEER